ncbi:hypothetical protein ACE15N_05925 [Xanthomonas campestris pv. passiflorae]|uniref:hypothetical protein n=1 Tax=Xanthomonas TaxID=338 RepID=UPI002426B10C|nr:hypothetical protein [Xanthomonas campestris]MBV6812417.1 hypothetical protein [Xanthomonas campestris pv. passiflorae]
MSDKPDDAGTPMEHYNSQVLALMEGRLLSGMQAALLPQPYYVIRHRETGVITTTASTTVGSSTKDAIFGPDTFSACNTYINSTVVTQLATSSPDFQMDQQHQSATTTLPSEGAPT